MSLTLPSGCPFCLEAANPKTALKLLSNEWPYNDRLIYESELVFAVPGYSPQVYPYVLVLPQRHTSSMYNTNSLERQSLFKCLQFLIDLLERNMGQEIALYVFEHGGCTNGLSRYACLEHAHYHIMVNQFEILTDFVTEKHPVSCTFDLESHISYDHYLFAGVYRGGDLINGFITAQDAHPPERQYFRRLLARRICDFRWNWRLGINESYMLRLKTLVGDRELRNLLPHD